MMEPISKPRGFDDSVKNDFASLRQLLSFFSLGRKHGYQPRKASFQSSLKRARPDLRDGLRGVDGELI